MFEFVLNDNEEVKPAFAHRISIFRIECHHEALRGSPCETFPAPGPGKDPNPPAKLLAVLAVARLPALSQRQVCSIDIIRLFRISKQFSRRAPNYFGFDYAQLHLDKLPNLAIDRNELRSLAPAQSAPAASYAPPGTR
jgi:hypothetical protein